ncbi:MAG TPA: type VII secretion protein EccB [Micromonosporaceae bacterium]|nr:type VII secretion protein EccB [Micromonosporaceae bacterium]
MRTRHEQVRAYRFVTRRIVSAMLSGEPDTAELPMRRLALALFASMIVGAIVLAVVGIYGFVNPSGGRPNESDIIIVRDTGARFVYLQGQLHPVLNHASARLVVGAAKPRIRSMSHRSLQGVPRGRPLGVRDAPDPLPDARALVGLPWSVCSALPSNTAGDTPTHLVVGRVPGGGTPLGDGALLVTTARPGSDGAIYLLWNDRRLRVPNRTVLTALELAATTPVRIGAPLLNSITAGPDLTPPAIGRFGEPSSRRVAGAAAKIGQVYRSGQQHYVLTEFGLVAIGPVTAALLLANSQAVEISAAQAAQVLSTAQVEPPGFPKVRPELRNAGNPTVCAAFRTAAVAADRPETTIELFGAGSEQLQGGANDVATTRDGSRTADRVVVEGGRGALVRSMPAPGVTAATTVHLVTDQGLSYALRDSEDVNAQAALGYGDVVPVPVPAGLLSLIPAGPRLDPGVARAFLGSSPTPPANAPPASPSRSATTSQSPSRSAVPSVTR